MGKIRRRVPGCAVGGREEAQAHAPHSSHRADSPRVYVAALTLLYHRPRLMIIESGTPARVRPTQSRWLETPASCSSRGGWKTRFIPPWQDGMLLLFQPGCIRAGMNPGTQPHFRRLAGPARAGGRTNLGVHIQSPRDYQGGPKAPTEKQARHPDRKIEATRPTNLGSTCSQAGGESRVRPAKEQDHGAPGVPSRPGPRGTAGSDCARTLRGLPIADYPGPDPMRHLRREASGEPEKLAGTAEAVVGTTKKQRRSANRAPVITE